MLKADGQLAISTPLMYSLYAMLPAITTLLCQQGMAELHWHTTPFSSCAGHVSQYLVMLSPLEVGLAQLPASLTFSDIMKASGTGTDHVKIAQHHVPGAPFSST